MSYVMAYVCNPHTWEVAAGGLWVKGQGGATCPSHSRYNNKNIYLFYKTNIALFLYLWSLHSIVSKFLWVLILFFTYNVLFFVTGLEVVYVGEISLS